MADSVDTKSSNDIPNGNSEKANELTDDLNDQNQQNNGYDNDGEKPKSRGKRHIVNTPTSRDEWWDAACLNKKFNKLGTFNFVLE